MQCDIIHGFLSAVDFMQQEDKRPKDYGTGEVLYYSEVKMLDTISRNPELNAVRLSKLMGITRGAVTQMSNKLEEKGYIVRYLQDGNKKAKYYRLTEAGKSIKRGHDNYHQVANQKICDYLKSLDEREIDIITGFLNKIKDLPISEFECSEQCHCKKE